MKAPHYGLTKHLPAVDYEKAVARVTEALADEGFGILTQIDVKQTLKKKLDADFRRYLILGACNPPFAHQALQAEPFIGLLLPCNVVVMEDDEGGSIVSIGDPKVILGVLDTENLSGLAGEIATRLGRVLDKL